MVPRLPGVTSRASPSVSAVDRRRTRPNRPHLTLRVARQDRGVDVADEDVETGREDAFDSEPMQLVQDGTPLLGPLWMVVCTGFDQLGQGLESHSCSPTRSLPGAGSGAGSSGSGSRTGAGAGAVAGSNLQVRARTPQTALAASVTATATDPAARRPPRRRRRWRARSPGRRAPRRRRASRVRRPRARARVRPSPRSKPVAATAAHAAPAIASSRRGTSAPAVATPPPREDAGV
jgi:hypothetical protein